MITCNQYDYIEIACMHRYPIKLTMKSDSIIEGIAQDTKRNDAREECILIKVEQADTLVILTDIAKLEVTIENPHFTEVTF